MCSRSASKLESSAWKAPTSGGPRSSASIRGFWHHPNGRSLAGLTKLLSVRHVDRFCVRLATHALVHRSCCSFCPPSLPGPSLCSLGMTVPSSRSPPVAGRPPGRRRRRPALPPAPAPGPSSRPVLALPSAFRPSGPFPASFVCPGGGCPEGPEPPTWLKVTPKCPRSRQGNDREQHSPRVVRWRTDRSPEAGVIGGGSRMERASSRSGFVTCTGQGSGTPAAVISEVPANRLVCLIRGLSHGQAADAQRGWRTMPMLSVCTSCIRTSPDPTRRSPSGTRSRRPTTADLAGLSHVSSHRYR